MALTKVAVDIKGFKKVNKALSRLGDPKTARKVGRKAGRYAVKLTRKSAKQKSPVETGALKSSIVVKVRAYPRKGVIWTGVGIKKVMWPDPKRKSGFREPRKYAHIQESKYNPFLEPAWHSTKIGQIKRWGDKVWMELQKIGRSP